MHVKRTLTLVVIGAALVAWLAGAATSNRDSAAPPILTRPAVDRQGADLAREIQRLHERLRPESTPRQPGRNLFAYHAAASRQRAAIVEAAQPASISEEALRRLSEYDWPGNVRELENVVERAVVLSRGQVITSRELPFGDHDGEHEGGEEGPEIPNEKSFFKRSVAQYEKDLIMKALRDAGGNRSKAAEMLGIYRRLLYAKIKEFALEGYPPKAR
jgi:hypothetical protein